MNSNYISKILKLNGNNKPKSNTKEYTKPSNLISHSPTTSSTTNTSTISIKGKLLNLSMTKQAVDEREGNNDKLINNLMKNESRDKNSSNNYQISSRTQNCKMNLKIYGHVTNTPRSKSKTQSKKNLSVFEGQIKNNQVSGTFHKSNTITNNHIDNLVNGIRRTQTKSVLQTVVNKTPVLKEEKTPSKLNKKVSSIDKYYKYINSSFSDLKMAVSSNSISEGINIDFDNDALNETFDNEYKNYHTSNNISSSYNKTPSPKQTINNGRRYSTINSSPSLLFHINLEDLMIMEEKLYQILENFRVSKLCSKHCFEWWNFYNYCSLESKLEIYFKEESHKKIVRNSSALELISIIISFEASNDQKILTTPTTINILKNLLYSIHQNFLIICDYILSKICQESVSNIWVNKIQNMILSKINKRLKKGENIVVMKQNNENIFAILKNIFRIYAPATNKNVDFSFIINYTKNLSKFSSKTLNEFMRKRVVKFYNKKGSSIPEAITVEEGESLPSIPVPYLKKSMTENKQFTLVLDLDETMIHFKINNETNKGILRLRPGLHEFLSKLKTMYEIVIFTAATQDYADPILDAIENEETYFDYRLYRQHAIIIENDFVKDLTKLGRDLSKCIIIDNMPQNFKLQKDNGIYIKSFYGEDADDAALFDLIPILTKIAENVDAFIDLRKEIKKFKNEIFRKITTNLERNKEGNVNQQEN